MIVSQIDRDERHDLLRLFFVPLYTAGHLIPMVDAARLFARHGGVDVTVVTTDANAAIFRHFVDADARAGLRIRVHSLPFPAEQVSLPAGVENLQTATSTEKWAAVGAGFELLREPIKRLLREARPDCLITDTYLPWTAGFAAELGVPRLAFHASSYIQKCAEHCLRLHQPASGEDDNEPVKLPGSPGDIKLPQSQIPAWIKTRTEFTYFMDTISDSVSKSFGVVFNSFKELESPYEDYYLNTMQRPRAWSIGPVFLACGEAAKAERYDFAGAKTTEAEIMEWLSSKEKSSVLFVGFGSLSRFHKSQITELALGLEACGHPFVWAFFREANDERCGGEEAGDGLPEGFVEREREGGRGLVIRGWAPQKRILSHPAIGGMVTHCGWNSVIEGVAAGLPMLTWPLFADQFFNEKLAVEVLGIGVGVGVREWRLYYLGEEREDVVRRERVAEAARELMDGGKEAEERRRRVRRLAEAAEAAVETGGSSHTNLVALINELKSLKSQGRANI